MSGRRRRIVNNDDSEEDSDEEDIEDRDDDDSESESTDSGEQGEPECETEIITLPEVDVNATKTGVSEDVKLEPTAILKRLNTNQQDQDRIQREENSRRREQKREADTSGQFQKKNSFHPGGNFFSHDDRDVGRLVGDDRGESQLTAANLNNRAHEDQYQRTRFAINKISLMHKKSIQRT